VICGSKEGRKVICGRKEGNMEGMNERTNIWKDGRKEGKGTDGRKEEIHGRKEDNTCRRKEGRREREEPRSEGKKERTNEYMEGREYIERRRKCMCGKERRSSWKGGRNMEG
jgi:hypothetical protein